jgi:hypothetical protein
MNPLKQHANLFANGRFKVQFHHPQWDEMLSTKIEGIHHQYLYLEHYSVTPSYFDCTLIARPISDMTDEEVNKMPRNELKLARDIDCDWEREDLVNCADDNYWFWEDMNYLLSIGVYPFDQSHFDDGTVIKSTDQ